MIKKIIHRIVLIMIMSTNFLLTADSYASSVEKKYVDNKMVEDFCFKLYEKIEKDGFKPDLLVGLSRGGLVPLGYLSNEAMLDIHNTLSISIASYKDKKQGQLTLRMPFHGEDVQQFKTILVIDDLADSGKTLEFVLSLLQENNPDAVIKTATLFYKKKSVIVPDYYIEETDQWIVFPWEKVN